MAKESVVTDDAIRALLEQDAAEGWNPTEGDVLMGTLLTVKASRPGGKYGTYPIMILRKDDGTPVAVHCFHELLRDALVTKKPAAGERVAVSYNGTRESKEIDPRTEKPREYNHYSLVVDRPIDTAANAIDWSQFGGSSEHTIELPADE